VTARDTRNPGRGPGYRPATRHLHRCPVGECGESVAPGRLMCTPHWRLVPRPLQGAVWQAWDGGRGRGTPAHTAAIVRAIGAAERAVAG
jgi:hypothetical protein